MAQLRQPRWDRSHLYAAMHNALERMEEHIIGEKASHIVGLGFIRKFSEAKELSRRLAKGDFAPKDYDLFTRTVSMHWTVVSDDLQETIGEEDHSFRTHGVKIMMANNAPILSVATVQEDWAIKRLAFLLETQSMRWWN